MSLQLVFLGAPGSGKGTQAKKVSSELGFKHVSTGDLLRAEIKSQSDLGQKVQKIIADGKLVDDQTVLELLAKNCEVQSSSFIFDGFPRNIEQTKLLDKEILNDVNSKAIYFEIDLSELMERITQRRTCKKCGEIYNLKSRPPKTEGTCDLCGGELQQRKDDNEDTVKTRLDVFQSEIEPILEYYEKSNRLKRVNASRSADEVFEEIKGFVEN